MKVTLKDIARETNLSVSAVSKALSNSPDISDSAKMQVLQVATQLGYRIANNKSTRALTEKKLLGVVIPDNSNPFYSNVLKGIESVASNSGYTLIVTNTNEDSEREAHIIRTLSALPLSGILAAPVGVKNFSIFQIPVMMLSRYPFRDFSRDVVTPDYDLTHNYVVNEDFVGQRVATAHLLEKGAKQVYALLGTNDPGNASYYKTSARLEGYLQATKEYNQNPTSNCIFFEVHTPARSYEITKQIILSNPEYPIGFCALNDFVALGIFRAAFEYNISIPSQIQVVGYDDNLLSPFFTPALTTVHCADKEMGKFGAMRLIDLIEGRLDIKQRISTVLTPYLVPRESS